MSASPSSTKESPSKSSALASYTKLYKALNKSLLRQIDDEERFGNAVGNSLDYHHGSQKRRGKEQSKKKSSRSDGREGTSKSKKTTPSRRALQRGNKSMRLIASAIKRSLQKSNQSSTSRADRNDNYAVALPSGMIKDVRGSVLATLLVMSMSELATHMMEQKVMNENSKWRVVQRNMGSLVQTSQSTKVQWVEVKTGDGGTKLVPKYEKGKIVAYKSAQGIVEGLILDVHLDDLLEPYYTIKLVDGKEKQTDNAHILMLPDVEKKPAAKNAGGGIAGATISTAIAKEDSPEQIEIPNRRRRRTASLTNLMGKASKKKVAKPSMKKDKAPRMKTTEHAEVVQKKGRREKRDR